MQAKNSGTHMYSATPTDMYMHATNTCDACTDSCSYSVMATATGARGRAQGRRALGPPLLPKNTCCKW